MGYTILKRSDIGTPIILKFQTCSKTRLKYYNVSPSAGQVYFFLMEVICSDTEDREYQHG